MIWTFQLRKLPLPVGMVGIHRSTRPCTWWTLGSFFVQKNLSFFFCWEGGGGPLGRRIGDFFLIKPHKIQHLYMIFVWLMIYEIDIWEHQSHALKKNCLSLKIFFHWNIWWWLESQVACRSDSGECSGALGLGFQKDDGGVFLRWWFWKSVKWQTQVWFCCFPGKMLFIQMFIYKYVLFVFWMLWRPFFWRVNFGGDGLGKFTWLAMNHFFHHFTRLKRFGGWSFQQIPSCLRSSSPSL